VEGVRRSVVAAAVEARRIAYGVGVEVEARTVLRNQNRTLRRNRTHLNGAPDGLHPVQQGEYHPIVGAVTAFFEGVDS
jgi:hypothetical protein